MQQKNEKTNILIKAFGSLIKDLREKKYKSSINKFSFENDLDKGNLSRLENGLIEAKLTTIWKICEALEMKPSQLFELLEKNLESDFTIINH